MAKDPLGNAIGDTKSRGKKDSKRGGKTSLGNLTARPRRQKPNNLGDDVASLLRECSRRGYGGYLRQ